MGKSIRAVVKYPNEDAKEVMLKNDYKAIAEVCEGLIDAVDLPTSETVTIFCNDSGMVNGMEPNIVTPEYKGVLCGPLVFLGYDPETGDSRSLSDEELNKSLKYCRRNMLHHMSLEGAYRYSKVIGPLQESEDELGIEM